jgi:hypothetical protein
MKQSIAIIIILFILVLVVPSLIFNIYCNRTYKEVSVSSRLNSNSPGPGNIRISGVPQSGFRSLEDMMKAKNMTININPDYNFSIYRDGKLIAYIPRERNGTNN